VPPKPTSADELLADLVDEHEDLDRLVAEIEAASFDLATPAEGWTVRDQLSHLAFFDESATSALVEPDVFSTRARELIESGSDPMEEHLRLGRDMDAAGVLGWWRRARKEMADAARASPSDARVPWYGPPMALKSFVSARLMETWAHGQDVADALGRRRIPTDRLRHVAHLGVRARPFSYAVRGLELPPGSVSVELLAPSGELWVWDEASGDAPVAAATSDPHTAKVSGSALDFCLVVTQRRHIDDTELAAEGELAVGWLEIAQAFAGPPGPGREPGGTAVR